MSQDVAARKDERYWRVLDTVIRLEVVKGHLAWKTTDLSRLSGVKRPLIYYYFGKSKEEIVRTALKIIGDELFGLSRERLELWREGRVAESVLRSRELLRLAPHVSEFYFHWRHQRGEIGAHFVRLEKRYREKLMGTGRSAAETEAIFAVFFGLVLSPGLSEETLRAVVSRLPL